MPVSETKGVQVSLEMKDYLADFIVGVYKEAKLQRLYPWQVSQQFLSHIKGALHSMRVPVRCSEAESFDQVFKLPSSFALLTSRQGKTSIVALPLVLYVALREALISSI